MVTFGDCECVSRLLCNTISMLCRNALKFDNELRVEGILGVTVDSDVIFLVRVNETLAPSSECNTSSVANSSAGIALASGVNANKGPANRGPLPCRPPAARRLALMPKPVSPAPEASPQRSSSALAWPLKSSSVPVNGPMASPLAAVRSPQARAPRMFPGPSTALVPKGRSMALTGPRFPLGRQRLLGPGARPRGVLATSRMGLRQRLAAPQSSPRALMHRLPIRGKSPSSSRSMGLRPGNMLAIKMAPEAQPAKPMQSPRRPTPKQGQLAIAVSPQVRGQGNLQGQMATTQSPSGPGNLQSQIAISQSPKSHGNMLVQKATAQFACDQGNMQGQMNVGQSPRGPGNLQGQLTTAQSLRGQGTPQGRMAIVHSPRALGNVQNQMANSLQGPMAIAQSPRGQGNLQNQLAIVQSPRGPGNMQGQTNMVQTPRGQGNLQSRMAFVQSPRASGNVQNQMAMANSLQGQMAIAQSPRAQGNVQNQMTIVQSPRGQGNLQGQLAIAQSPRAQGNLQNQMTIVQSPRGQGNLQGQLDIAQSPRAQGNLQNQMTIVQSPRGQGNLQGQLAIAQSPRARGNLQNQMTIVQSPRGQGNMQGQLAIAQSPRARGNFQNQMTLVQSPRGQGNLQGRMVPLQSLRFQDQGNVQGQMALSQSLRAQGSGNQPDHMAVATQSPKGHEILHCKIAVTQSQKGQGEGNIRDPMAMAQLTGGQGNLQGQIATSQLPKEHQDLSQLLREVANNQLSLLNQPFNLQNLRQVPDGLTSSKSDVLRTSRQQGAEQQGLQNPVVHVQSRPKLAVPPSSYQLMTQLSPGLILVSPSHITSSGALSQPVSWPSVQVSPGGAGHVGSNVMAYSAPHTIRPNTAVQSTSLSQTNAQPGYSMPTFQVAPVSHGICREPIILSVPASLQTNYQNTVMSGSRSACESPPGYRQVAPNLHSYSLAPALETYRYQLNTQQLRQRLLPEYRHCPPVNEQYLLRERAPLQTRPSTLQQMQPMLRPPISQVMPSGRQAHELSFDCRQITPGSGQSVAQPSHDHLNRQTVPFSGPGPEPNLCRHPDKDMETFVQQLNQLNASEDQFEGYIKQFLAEQMSPVQPKHYQPQFEKRPVVSEATPRLQSAQQQCGQLVSSRSEEPSQPLISEMSDLRGVEKSLSCSRTVKNKKRAVTSTSSSSSANVCSSTSMVSSSDVGLTPAGHSMPEKPVQQLTGKEKAFLGQIDPDEDSQSSDSTVISNWCDLELDVEPEASISLVMSDSSTSCISAERNLARKSGSSTSCADKTLASKLTSESSTSFVGAEGNLASRSESSTSCGGTESLHGGKLACRFMLEVSSSGSDLESKFTCKARECNKSFTYIDQLSLHYIDSHECDWGPPKDRKGRSIYEKWMVQQSKNTARASSGFDCDKCQRKFFSSHGLRRHRETMHKSFQTKRRKLM